MKEACLRTLTIPETEILQQAVTTHPESLYIPSDQLPQFIELNRFLAFDIVPLYLKLPTMEEYLESLLTMPVSSNGVDVIHHIIAGTNPIQLPEGFLHMYISNCIRSCDVLEGHWQDKQVRLVAKFIQSLLVKRIIPMAEYLIEVQSFCIGFLRFRGVAALYRLVSGEAQRIGYELGMNTSEEPSTSARNGG
ncbi:hypothetical protein EC973_002201 [Apophysomyces ossiformis]|uniref:CCR4-NOT transcription complex subunit 11 n=1 Tax=Apophysomyces ossiformis TaxID=679940 RepID=A0A8H7ET59_9FUNG|nr:hypothetical protein EC973_002201 [Apophysomyces ossiformis]